jgi:hypothetical protein
VAKFSATDRVGGKAFHSVEHSRGTCRRRLCCNLFFELVINLKVAKELGLELAPEFVTQAVRLIE